MENNCCNISIEYSFMNTMIIKIRREVVARIMMDNVRFVGDNVHIGGKKWMFNGEEGRKAFIRHVKRHKKDIRRWLINVANRADERERDKIYKACESLDNIGVLYNIEFGILDAIARALQTIDKEKRAGI